VDSSTEQVIRSGRTSHCEASFQSETLRPRRYHFFIGREHRSPPEVGVGSKGLEDRHPFSLVGGHYVAQLKKAGRRGNEKDSLLCPILQNTRIRGASSPNAVQKE